MKILNRSDVEKIVTVPRAVEAVEKAYKLKAEGKTEVWPTVIKNFETGKKETDIKSGYIREEEIHGLKAVNWTVANEKKGLPAMVGMILLFNTDTGMPEGIVDGGYITGIRTGAAGAVGARYLSRKNPGTLFVLGTGEQAKFQIASFLYVFPELRKIYVCNVHHPEKAVKFAAEIGKAVSEKLNIEVPEGLQFEAVRDMEEAVKQSDLIVTATPSRTPLIKEKWLKKGTHLSCIGSDMSGKQEIESSIMVDARIFCDDKPHCLEAGEVEKPIREGYIEEDDILGEIGEVITGRIPGRISEDDITVFDATGMAILDLIVAKAALKEAEKENMGKDVDF